KFLQLDVQNPRVWWAYPLGGQDLYMVSMHFQVKDTASAAAEAGFTLTTGGSFSGSTRRFSAVAGKSRQKQAVGARDFQSGELDFESSDRAILLGMGFSPGQIRWPALKRDAVGDIHSQGLKALVPRLPQQAQQPRLLEPPVQVRGFNQTTPHISS